jgi:hypothetical protein
MDQSRILYPVVALAALTLWIALWMGRQRVLAVRRGDLSAPYHALIRGGKAPEHLAKVSQDYDDPMQLPILFYAFAGLLSCTGKGERRRSNAGVRLVAKARGRRAEARRLCLAMKPTAECRMASARCQSSGDA